MAFWQSVWFSGCAFSAPFAGFSTPPAPLSVAGPQAQLLCAFPVRVLAPWPSTLVSRLQVLSCADKSEAATSFPGLLAEDVPDLCVRLCAQPFYLGVCGALSLCASRLPCLPCSLARLSCSCTTCLKHQLPRPKTRGRSCLFPLSLTSLPIHRQILLAPSSKAFQNLLASRPFCSCHRGADLDSLAAS